MRIWYLVAGVLAAAALILGGIAVFSGDASPRAYVEKHFQRAAARDIDAQVRAYTSAAPPSHVAEDVVRAWAPAGRYADGSGVYLRYSSDAVVIRPDGTGTLILVEEVRGAYRRYSGTLGATGWSGK